MVTNTISLYIYLSSDITYLLCLIMIRIAAYFVFSVFIVHKPSIISSREVKKKTHRRTVVGDDSRSACLFVLVCKHLIAWM